jgi:predicted transposase YbfD/YdcC
MARKPVRDPKSMGPAPDAGSFVEYFSAVSDPRSEQTQHPLLSILVLCLCAVISGSNGPTAIEDFGHARRDFLEKLVPFPNGIPSHDTIGRVLGMLNPKKLESAFADWMRSVIASVGEVIAIDGKSLRRARNVKDGHYFVHMVSAWATANRVVLGQVRTDQKSNEITAIPKLLELLQIEGCIVTIDAMGCQKDIVAKIVDQGGDYVIPVKDNQPTLFAAVSEHFDERFDGDLAPSEASFHETHNKGHGRFETRRCWTLPVPDDFPVREEWKGLATLIHIQSERRVGDDISVVDRWHISSRAPLSAEVALDCIRTHWGIENQLHWTLDVAFDEDQSRVRAKNAAESLAVIRHAALNYLRSATSITGGIARKRLKAGYDVRVLAKILNIPADGNA